MKKLFRGKFLGRLDRYIITKFLGHYFFSIALIISIAVVFDYNEHIDKIDSQLPALRSFILPGGCTAAAQCHVCRTVCRRAERLITALTEEAPVNEDLCSFVNRLSDFLFVFARFLNKMKGVDEISWKNDCD